MNRRGFLLGEETLKVVLAVICIIFLIYVLASLYYGGFGDEDLKLAKASVKHLADELNAGATEIEIYNPEDWVILNLPQNEEWICICEKSDKCDPDENCARPKEKIIISGEIKIESPLITLQLNEGVLSLK